MTEKEDPIVMYLIVRESLGMSPGKIGAQTGHATEMLSERYYEKLIVVLDKLKEDENYLMPMDLITWQDWKKMNRAKIVLGADDKEFEKIKELGLNMVVVRDAGLTEVKSGSETCIGIWPQKKSDRSNLIKRLQLL